VGGLRGEGGYEVNNSEFRTPLKQGHYYVKLCQYNVTTSRLKMKLCIRLAENGCLLRCYAL
jgi:hypothetical protein